MYAIEFETDITDRFIEIKEYDKVANQHAKVIILVEQNNKVVEKSMAGALKKYANPSLIENEKEIAWTALAEAKKNALP